MVLLTSEVKALSGRIIHGWIVQQQEEHLTNNFYNGVHVTN